MIFLIDDVKSDHLDAYRILFGALRSSSWSHARMGNLGRCC